MENIKKRFIIDGHVITKYNSGILKITPISLYNKKADDIANIQVRQCCNRLCASRIFLHLTQDNQLDYIFEDRNDESRECGCHL